MAPRLNGFAAAPLGPAMPLQMLRAGSARLAVEVVRPVGGEPRGDVLLLHGFPDDASIWDPQIEALTAAG